MQHLEQPFDPLKLHLHAWDQHSFISACAYMQDMLCPVTSFHWTKGAFHLWGSRFCWEEAGDNVFYRIHCAIKINNVMQVEKRGFHQHGVKRILSLLTLSYENDFLTFLFSERAELRLHVSDFDMYLTDIPPAWTTTQRPIHLYEHAS